MRSWIIILLTLASFPCFAQQGYNYFSMAGGLYHPEMLIGEMSLEFGQKYYRMWEVNFDYAHRDRMTTFTIPPTTEEGEPTVGERREIVNSFKGGIIYKPVLFRSRNMMLSFRTGASLGTNTHQFIAGATAGFEFSYTTKQGIVLFLRQKNEVVFWDDDTWRVGGLVGLKVPLN
ncbi:hypothetical protein [Persicobacter diffluens]|uniref:Outer membrane protein beta-barrel domain-containing protein n=2 Tax=Persicobacter diffluens TaxID=981 RepID=A0AAN4W4U3_9BACT|nr:hypothetical protein PEDI_52480 [Persicobacter diffluens]